MAKRTRYPKRTTPKPAARRAQGAGSEARARIVPARPDAHEGHAHEGHLHGDAFGGPARASSAGLTEAEMQRAAELEVEVAAQERAAIAESLRRRNRAAAGDDRVLEGDVNAPLSVRAAHEYAYVARDVRRIALTGGLTVAILAVLHVLVNVMGVISI